MIREQELARLRCWKCGGDHYSKNCNAERATKSDAPLETPSHNGPYRGTATVRVVPTGICGDQLGEPKLTAHRQSVLRGIAARSRKRKLERAERETES